jgi:hypothetical protein
MEMKTQTETAPVWRPRPNCRALLQGLPVRVVSLHRPGVWMIDTGREQVPMAEGLLTNPEMPAQEADA